MRKKSSVFFSFILLVMILTACPADTENSDKEPPIVVKTGKVTFFNVSGHKVVIHQDAFSGPVLLELSAAESKTIDVRISDNYGVGSTFSIEYVLRHQIIESIGGEIREVSASAIDPNVQINCVIEENKLHYLTIPQPLNLEPRSAFVCILNSHNLPFELRYLSTVFKQADNGNISVPPFTTGIYKLPLGTEGSIPDAGKTYRNYEVVSAFASTTIPDFTAKNGKKYICTYDGNSVTEPKEESI